MIRLARSPFRSCRSWKSVAYNSRGFGLIEVVIAAGIGGVILMSMSTMMSSLNQSLRSSRTTASRDQLVTRIGREAGNHQSLKLSLAYNGSDGSGFPGNTGGASLTMFEKCVNGGAPNGCIAQVGGNAVSYGFTLTDSFGKPIAGPADATAGVYDASGAACPNASIRAPTVNCPIIVTTTFTPNCSNGKPACDQAASILVTYKLAQAAGVNLSTIGSGSLKDMIQSVTTPVPFDGVIDSVGNMLAKWTSTTQLGSSSVYEDASRRLGIGTTSPAYQLDLQETRTDTASGKSVTLNLAQTISPAAASASWYIPAYIHADSGGGTNQNIDPGTEAVIAQVNWNETSANLQSAYGAEGEIKNNSTGVISSGIGVYGIASNLAGGTITTGIGVQGYVANSGPGTISAAYGGNFKITNTAGAITSGYGIRINEIQAANAWSIYSSDASAPSYFAGKVGIGTTSPGYPLDVTGDVNSGTALRVAGTQVCTSSGCTATSDVRLKQEIEPLNDSLENILKLQGVSYYWKDPEKYGPSQQIGLIAQELEKVYPQVVLTDSKTGFKSVAYDHLIAPVIEAVKVLNSKITQLLNTSENQSRDIASLKAENKNLKQENAACNREIAELKARLDKIEKAFTSK